MGNYMGEHTNSRLIRNLSQEHPSALCMFSNYFFHSHKSATKAGNDGSQVTVLKLHLNYLGCPTPFTSSPSLWSLVLGADRRLGCVQVIFLIKRFITHFDVPIFKVKKKKGTLSMNYYWP